ncbi:hypothetical protein Avbf_00858 [Armadillidium vulgare]|nr:hypothetical protein Avbf_00858 [Armadillidium vulgare]
MSSQNINVPYSIVNSSIDRESPVNNNGELENISEEERLHCKIRRYDVGCSFLRAFELEQKLNTHNPVDFLFNKVNFKSSVINVDKHSCSSDVDKFLLHKKNNTTLEVRDSNSNPKVMSHQYILPHNNSLKQNIKIECDQDLSLPELDISLNPYLPVKESDICEVKDEEILSLPEFEERNKSEEHCVKSNKQLEDDGVSKVLKREAIELEVSEKAEENQFTNAKKLWIDDFDKENIPKPAISNETVSPSVNTENSGLKQSALLHNEGQRNKVPVLVIKKSGSSENSSEEWLVSKEKSATLEEGNNAKTIDFKTKITQSFVPEKNPVSVDPSNSNLTLKFKRVEKPLSSEYKVVNSKSVDECKLNSVKVTEKHKLDSEVRHELPLLTQEITDKDQNINVKEKPTNIVPPLILLKKENAVIETFTSKKRVKHTSETSSEKPAGEDGSNSDDLENLSLKIYPKVFYKAKRLKGSRPINELPHSNIPTTERERSFQFSKSLKERLHLQSYNKNLLLNQSQRFPFVQNPVSQNIDISSPSSFKLVLPHISKSVPSASSASGSSIQEPICSTDDDNVTVKDLDLHSNVSFGRLSFNDAACMPSGVNFNDATCMPSKVSFSTEDSFISASKVSNFSKKNSKKS